MDGTRGEPLIGLRLGCRRACTFREAPRITSRRAGEEDVTQVLGGDEASQGLDIYEQMIDSFA
jgi:hypothetical protein